MMMNGCFKGPMVVSASMLASEPHILDEIIIHLIEFFVFEIIIVFIIGVGIIFFVRPVIIEVFVMLKGHDS